MKNTPKRNSFFKSGRDAIQISSYVQLDKVPNFSKDVTQFFGSKKINEVGFLLETL